MDPAGRSSDSSVEYLKRNLRRIAVQRGKELGLLRKGKGLAGWKPALPWRVWVLLWDEIGRKPRI